MKLNRKCSAIVIVGAVLVGVIAAAAAQTNTSAPAEPTLISIDVKDTDIARVLDAFSQQTGLSVVVGKEVEGAISVRLVNVPWDRALESILKP